MLLFPPPDRAWIARVSRRHLVDPHNSEVFDIDHALATHSSVVGSRNYRHGIRHPIFGPDPGCMAEAALAGNMVEMQKELLRSGAGLRLMQQQLVRSDPDPAAAADGICMNLSAFPTKL